MTTDMGMPPILSPDEAERTVLLAAPRGYCAGVDRAVITVEQALELYGAPVYVRKQIVHNKHVVADLESRGAIFVEELDEVPEGRTVVFSAHGVSPLVRRNYCPLRAQAIRVGVLRDGMYSKKLDVTFDVFPDAEGFKGGWTKAEIAADPAKSQFIAHLQAWGKTLQAAVDQAYEGKPDAYKGMVNWRVGAVLPKQ